MTDSNPVCELFALIAELGIAEGVAPIKGKVWTLAVDQNWTIAVNATDGPAHVEPEGAMAIDVPRFECAVWWNGWLAGLFSPFGGTIAAHPSGANEDALLAAMRKRIEGWSHD